MPVSFENIKIGSEYDRPSLSKLWGYKSFEAIARGVVAPKGTPFIILFITHEKQEFLPQYADSFAGDILEIDGEQRHGTDLRLVNAEKDGHQTHLFYRSRHHALFTYQGQIYLAEHTLYKDKPSRFRFTSDPFVAKAENAIVTELETHNQKREDFIPDTEGAPTTVGRVEYKRSLKNRAECLRLQGFICKGCGFDFNAFYGPDFARSFIEVHHVRSVAEQVDKQVDPAKDLVPLCSNCHSMVHRVSGEILSLEELRTLIDNARS